MLERNADKTEPMHDMNIKGIFFAVHMILLSAALRLPAQTHFVSAVPEWAEGRAEELNSNLGFFAEFESVSGGKATLALASSGIARVWLNGEFAAYGPARGPKGYYRVDKWDLQVKPGRNVIAIEAAAYNVVSYYLMKLPGFLQAEITQNGKVLAATGGGFDVCELSHRVRKCSRYSFQRPFGEAYRVTPASDAWRISGIPAALRLGRERHPSVRHLPRSMPYPEFALRPMAATGGRPVEILADAVCRRPWSDGAVKGYERLFGFAKDELEIDLYREQQLFRGGMMYDLALNDTGFVRLEVECTRPGRIAFTFDEVLDGAGEIDCLRHGCANIVVWDLLEPGRYVLETFEPYTLRYGRVSFLSGEGKVVSASMREYKNPDAYRARFDSDNAREKVIFEAARETFAQNAVDTYTDCPGRERAGWLCDSFFTARAAQLFTGSTGSERTFLENYLLAEDFAPLPRGMVPMCYPADHPKREFIPNWSMWLILELEEYLARSGDRALVDAFRPRVQGLLDFYAKYLNSDGLLEKLPSWVFIEWSKANHLVQDVNYPSNMTYAEVLDAAARLYGMPELAVRAEKVRETVRRQSWTGEWFCDNALRQKDGSLRLSGECTETCQYYAFYFKTATKERYPGLWRTLVEDFGPGRKKTGKHPKIWPSNAFIGNYLRLECLSREGLKERIRDEIEGYFMYMAERTGTLWEHDSTRASCNHGFASHAAVYLVRDLGGRLTLPEGDGRR